VYPVLAAIFFLTLLISLALILGFILKPLIWCKNISRIKLFCLFWFVPYFIFICFFTGPEDLSLYPPAANSPYRLPWKSGVTRFVAQGNRSFTSHRGTHRFAWDFVMPNGTQILAARAGRVAEVKDAWDGIGLNSNFISIEHEDGQRSMYAHIRFNGSLVKVGESVNQGQPVALSGMVGQTVFPHVHFYVMNKEETLSIPISFADVPGGVPFAGHFYTSGNVSRLNFQSLFRDRDVCFVMKQISTGQIVESYNPKRCAERFSPNSTFKIPAALMAFEKGILKTENQVIKWDGTHNDREELNQDQTPFSWMDRSVVWVTQWITPQLKSADIKFFLKDFNYGNQDFSGGVKTAWLDSSLKISANEQIEFLTRFWQEDLSLSKSTFEKSKKIIFIKNLSPTAELFGKTGTSCAFEGCGIQTGHRRGWFVGVVKTKTEAYAFAANADDLKSESAPAGPKLRKDLIQALSEMELK
jgi:beta-lactamase class D